MIKLSKFQTNTSNLISLESQYETMWDKFQSGKISEEDWNKYCSDLLDEIIQQPEIQQIFNRLKLR